jgi:hypothetical protein
LRRRENIALHTANEGENHGGAGNNGHFRIEKTDFSIKTYLRIFLRYNYINILR